MVSLDTKDPIDSVLVWYPIRDMLENGSRVEEEPPLMLRWFALLHGAIR